MLGDNIRNYRKANNMSQDELAEILHVTRQSVSLWETGQTQPSLDSIVAMAKLFNVSADVLLTDDKPEAADVDEEVAAASDCDTKNKRSALLIVLLGVFVVAVIAIVIALLWAPDDNDIKTGNTGTVASVSSTPKSDSTSSTGSNTTVYNETENADGSNTGGASQVTSINSGVSSKNEPNNTSKPSSSGTTQNNSSKNNTQTSSNSTVSNNITLNNLDNGVLKKASAQKMDVPENMKLLGTDDAKEENNSATIKATVVLYQLDGDVVSWKTENDLIYAITSGNNRLVVIDSKTMTAVYNVSLAGTPAEINLVGDKIYISLPDLCRIDVFSKSSLAKTSSLYFEHEVSSFCIDGDYIYYSEHDQHCAVYKKNMTTKALTQILPDSGFSFYEPKLYLNKQDNILYIGETGSTGNTIFYYDATTLQLKSLFRKNDYGIMNHTKEIFHIGNEIFWGNYRLSDTNAKEIIGRYGEADYGSVNFASEELVSTFEGIFLTDTHECIVNYFDAGFKFEYILVTKSNNVFFRARSIDRNIIIGVNFSVQ